MAERGGGRRAWRGGRRSRLLRVEDLYPYLVTADYPDASPPSHVRRPVGHGLSLALVSQTGLADDQVVGSLDSIALERAGLDTASAYARAGQNLTHALSTGRPSLRLVEAGPSGCPVVVVDGHWLAATTLVAPGLHDRMTRLLGEDVNAAVPHRDLLLIFAASTRAAMSEIIADEFDSAPKPLTTGLFAFDRDGPTPIP